VEEHLIKAECVYEAVQKMIADMKEQVAKTQNIKYPEQLRVAEIYNVVANNLAVACRTRYGKIDSCKAPEDVKNSEITMDTFIMLTQLKQDGLISEEYFNALFEGLVKMKPELEPQVRADREKGLL
jgi:Asp-tRNA(Asn)/Glu-tRNA(Gln) amidotransferase A subunit family amidase